MYNRDEIQWASGAIGSPPLIGLHYYAIHGAHVLAEILPPFTDEPHFRVIGFGDEPGLAALHAQFGDVPSYTTLAEAKAAVMDALCGPDVETADTVPPERS